MCVNRGVGMSMEGWIYQYRGGYVKGGGVCQWKGGYANGGMGMSVEGWVC